jgi:hypothetical protein
MGARIVRDRDERGRERTTLYCSRGPRPIVCHYCGKPGAWLCDFKVGGGTCDRPLCIDHAKRVAFQTDYCPEHAAPQGGQP